MGAENEQKSFQNIITGVGLSLAVLFGILLLPSPEGLTPVAQKALAIFCMLLVLWATEPIPLPIISLLVLCVVTFLNVLSPTKALAGFAATSVYLIAGALMLSVAMEKTGFAERVVYLLMSKVGCGTKRITFGIMISNIVLAFLVPSSGARAAILLPVCLGLIGLIKKATGNEGRSNFAVALLLTLTFTNATISAGILTATIPNPLIVELIHKAGGPLISYEMWFTYGFPPALLMTVITWWFIGVVFKPEVDELPGGMDMVREMLVKKGKMSVAEQKTFAVFMIVLVMWVTGSLTKIDTTIAVLFGIALLFILQVITWADVNKTKAFYFLLIMGGGFMVGDMLVATGAANWVAGVVFKSFNLSSFSTLTLVLVVMIIAQYLHIPFLGTTKMAVMVMPIVIGLAQAAGLPIEVLALPAGMIISGYPLILFYNTTPSLIVFGSGELRMSDFPKAGIFLCTVACFVYALCAFTYWRWLGLF